MSRVKIDNLGSIGVIKDIPEQELPPEAFTTAVNVRFTTKGASSFLGDRKVMASAITEPKWLTQIPPTTRPFWVYGDETKQCVFDGTSHTDITRAGVPYSGNANERWNGAFLNGILIVNNTIDIPQMWTSFLPGTRMQDLSNWPVDLRAKSIRTFKNFLFALNLREGASEFPFRVRWSHPAQPGTVPVSWVVGNPAFDGRQVDLGGSEDELLDGIEFGDLFIAYRERSAHGFQFIGGAQKFRNWRLLDEGGILTRDCVQSTPKGLAVLGTDDIYFHNAAQNSNVSIVHDRVRKWLFSIISPNNYFNSFTVKNPQENEVWFCVPETGATYATFALTWNWLNGNIGYRELDEIPFASSGVIASTDDDSGSWGE